MGGHGLPMRQTRIGLGGIAIWGCSNCSDRACIEGHHIQSSSLPFRTMSYGFLMLQFS